MTNKAENQTGSDAAQSNEPRAQSPIRTLSPPKPPSRPKGGKGGEGGDRPPIAVTNKEFLAAIFPEVPDGAHPLILGKAGDPSDGGWLGFDASEVNRHCLPDTNNYVNCSSFRPSGEGLRAVEEKTAAYHCLVLDDIGTKTPLAALPEIEPTWMLETSPGNYQVGYRLTQPVSHLDEVKAAQRRIKRTGLGDKGAGGTGRWVRLPVGINGKPKYRDEDGRPFRCRIKEWNPAVSYELAELVNHLAPSTEESEDARLIQPVIESRSHTGINPDVFRPALPENSVVTALKSADLYKCEEAPGRHSITCPWVSDHTDGVDGGTYFYEPSPDYPLGGFKCFHSHGDATRLSALLDHLEMIRSDVYNKPRIRIIEGELQTIVNAAQVVLAETGEFFHAGGQIVAVSIDKATGAASLKPQTDADLTLVLSRAAEWERPDKLAFRRCNPLPNAVRLLVQTQSHQHLPVLKGIARQPLLNPDGELISRSGYDPGSQLYCAFDPSKFARPEPTEANARAALGRLTHLLREFHFATPLDRAAALAAIFTAVLRPGLGRAPAFHVRAPSPGSGKSLLCDVIARFAGPGDPAKVSYPRSDDEATKVVLATLMQAPAVLDFDDMTADWRPYGAINRLLTSRTMTDRILGLSKMATVSTDTLVLASGNNTGPAGDLLRRVVVIHLDARSEMPATLRYEGDPLREVESKREAFVADILTIAEAWIAAGKPGPALSSIATYGGGWTDFCRRPLVWLGIDDPATGLIEQLRHDPESAALGALLEAWSEQFGDKAMTLRAVLADAEIALQEALEDLPFVSGINVDRSRFGHYLRRNAGRPFAGLRLEKAESRERNAWRVIADVSRAAPLPPLPPLPPSSGPARGDGEQGS